MGFYLLSDLSNLSGRDRKHLIQCLETLGTESKNIAKLLPITTQESAQQILPEIVTLLRKYSRMISDRLLDRHGKPREKLKRIEEAFFKTIIADAAHREEPTLFELVEKDMDAPVEFEDRAMLTQADKDDITHLSNLSVAFVMLVESYIANAENYALQSEVHPEPVNIIIKQGIILLGTIHAWMVEEVELTPKFLKHKDKMTEIETRRKSTADAREERQRRFEAIHAEIIQEYNRLVEETPSISKNKAAEIISRKGIGNLSFIAVRRHLPTG